MIVLDTTVLVYAKGADHALRAPCRTLIDAIANHGLQATTSVEVIQEFTHVRARHRDRAEAAALGRDYAELLSPLLAITADDLGHGLSLFEQFPRLGAFDAVLAAGAGARQARALVSADAAFAELPDIEHVVPDEPGVRLLLS